MENNTITHKKMAEAIAREILVKNRTGSYEKWIENIIDGLKQYHASINKPKGGIEKLFDNNSDCYADTREECNDTIPPTLVEGKVIPAMTKQKFIEVVSKIKAKEGKSEGEWQTEKPIFREDCILITSTFLNNQWEYKSWLIIRNKDLQYTMWCEMDGEEYGDIADLKADRYKVVPFIDASDKPKTEPPYTNKDVQGVKFEDRK